MASKNKMVQVSIVEKKFFVHRVVSNNTKLGSFLYDGFIKLLESIGEEKEFVTTDLPHVLFFTQHESGHKRRVFIVNEKTALCIRDYFAHPLNRALDEFGKDCKKEGTNILMGLSSGEMTINDFKEKVTKKK